MQIADLLFSHASLIFFKKHKEDNQRHGYGEMYYVDEGWYKGYWENGRQHEDWNISCISVIHNSWKFMQV